MLKVKLIFVLAALAILGCKKEFEHKVIVPEDCAQCASVDALQGKYRGFASGIAVYQATYSPGMEHFSDSLTVLVSHVFLSKGQFIDSTQMVLQFGFLYDHGADTIFEKLEIGSDNSFAYGFEQQGGSVSYINQEELRLKYISPGAGGGEVLQLDFTGFRIP